MSETHTCSACGAELAANAPRGLCPACLMRHGLEANTTGFTAEDASKAHWTPPAPDELSARFPELEITRLIGRGGMGAVYQARQRNLDRVVALKILPPEMGQDAAFKARFAREAQALARLNHPHIVTIHDFGERAGWYYFVMEYVDGVSLRGLLDSGHVSPKEALAIVPQICDALQFAHDQGIVHRDIKPENILLSKQGQVKIADFGLAKLMGRTAPADASLLTAPHPEISTVAGTPQYMAPEQKDRPQEVDHRADIYSLGVVFYQMLTGELPVGIFARPSRKVQIDVRLDEVVLRALEKEPGRRYQHVSEVKTEVETILGTPLPPGEGRVMVPNPSPSTGEGRVRVAPPSQKENQAGFHRTQGVPPVTRSSPVLTPVDEQALASARRQVKGPAIGLLIFGIISPLTLLYDFSFIYLHWPAFSSVIATENYWFLAKFGVGIFSTLIELILCSLIIFSAIKMKRLEAYALSVTAGFLAFIPFFHPIILLLGIPIGIWTLVVLRRHKVRVAFKLQASKKSTNIASPANGRPPMPPAAASRCSRLAIAGVTLLVTPFIFATIIQLGGILSLKWSFLIGIFALALLGTTICGLVSLSQIRCSAGRLYGLGLALFDALFFPLLLLDGLIGGMCVWLARLIVDFYANPALAANPQVHPDFLTRFANLLAEHSEIPILIALGIALVADVLIIRWAWRAAKKPLGKADATVPVARRKTSRAVIALAFVCLLLVIFGTTVLIPLIHTVNSPAPTLGQPATQPIVTPAQLAEPPRLRFLAWQDENPDFLHWRAWHPDRTPVVDDSSLHLLNHLHPPPVYMGGASEGKKPRVLYLWFAHPAFENNSFVQVTLLDDAGHTLSNATGLGFTKYLPTDSTENLGWIVYAVSPGYFNQMPSTVNVRLEYSLGPWTNRNDDLPSDFHGSGIPSDYNGSGGLGCGAMLGSLGQTAKGRAFINVLRYDTATPDNQNDFLAVTRDGREVAHTIFGSQGGPGLMTDTFEFPVPIDQVKSFSWRTRPIRKVEFKNVPLPPSATASQPAATAPASQPATRPTTPGGVLRPRDLSGTWVGERDGVNAKIQFFGVDDATLRFNTHRAGISALLKVVEEDAGTVGLRFDYGSPATGKVGSVVMGTLMRNSSGSLFLTILPAAKQLGDEWQQVAQIPLQKLASMEGATSTESATQPAIAPPSFGPVMERTIPVAGTTVGIFFLNFATGHILTPPSEMPVRDDKQIAVWITRNHADVSAEELTTGPRLWGGIGSLPQSCKFKPVPSEQWERITPIEVFASVQADAWVHEAATVNPQAIPATFLFQTREGTMGVLQLLGFADKPRRVKIRYKVVQNFIANLPAASVPASQPTLADKETALNLTLEGWGRENNGKFGEAEAKFQAAVEKDPTNASAWNGLGWSQFNQGNPLHARYAFEKCLTIEPKLAGALNGLGWLAKGAGQTEQALEYWKKAVTVMPAATASLSGLGWTYFEQGRYDQAIATFQAWLKVEPQSPEALSGLKKAQEAAVGQPSAPASQPSTLTFGPEVKGLRAAVELIPEKGVFVLGMPIEVRFHIRNVSAKTIYLAGESWRQGDWDTADILTMTIKDEQDRRIPVRGIFYSGAALIQRNVLYPGENAVFHSSGLMFLAPDADEKKVSHPVGKYVKVQPGRYTVSDRLRFPNFEGSAMLRPDDWQGCLETAPVTVEVKPAKAYVIPPGAQNLSFSHVIERTIPVDGTTAGTHFLSFERGQFRTLPPDPPVRDEKQVADWITRNHMDAMVVELTTGPRLGGDLGSLLQGCRFQRVPLEQWDRLTPAEILAAVQVAPGQHEAATVNPQAIPATFLFRTRENTMGVLQILGFADNPRGVKIHYKLVEGIAASKPVALAPASQPATQPTSTPVTTTSSTTETTARLFLKALAQGDDEALTKLCTTDYLSGHPRLLEGFKKMRDTSDFSQLAVAQVWAPTDPHVRRVQTQTAAVSTFFSSSDKSRRAAFGLKLLREGDQWLVRNVAILPDEQAVERFLADYRAVETTATQASPAAPSSQPATQPGSAPASPPAATRPKARMAPPDIRIQGIVLTSDTHTITIAPTMRRGPTRPPTELTFLLDQQKTMVQIIGQPKIINTVIDGRQHQWSYSSTSAELSALKPGQNVGIEANDALATWIEILPPGEQRPMAYGVPRVPGVPASQPSHIVAGTLVKVDGNNLIVKSSKRGEEGRQITVATDDNTHIKVGLNSCAYLDDLKPGMSVDITLHPAIPAFRDLYPAVPAFLEVNADFKDTNGMIVKIDGPNVCVRVTEPGAQSREVTVATDQYTRVEFFGEMVDGKELLPRHGKLEELAAGLWIVVRPGTGTAKQIYISRRRSRAVRPNSTQTATEAAEFHTASGPTTRPAPVSRLDFRVAAVLDSNALAECPSVTPDAVKTWVRTFPELGPRVLPADSPVQWYELGDTSDDDFILTLPPGNTLVLWYNRRPYALLANRPNCTLLAEQDGRRTWGLQRVYLAKDNRNHPAIGFDFDAAGTTRFGQLTAMNLHRPLAMLINNKVVAVEEIQSALNPLSIIKGGVNGFGPSRASEIVAGLSRGMPSTTLPAPRFQIRLVVPDNDTTTPADEFPNPNDYRNLSVARTVLLDETDLAGVTTVLPAIPYSGHKFAIILTPAGKDRLARLTADHVEEQLAMIFDGQVLFAPRILGPVLCDRVYIFGAPGTTGIEDQILADKLRALIANPLPASPPASAPVTQPAPSTPASQPATSPTMTDKNAAETLYREGWHLLGIGNGFGEADKFPAAEEKFQAAVAKDPANANAWNGLGWSQFHQGQPLQARAAFEKCLTIAPQHANALLGLGWIAKGQGQTDRAIEYWKQAVAAHPNTPALIDLASIYLEQKRYDLAVEILQAWLKAEPQSSEALSSLKKAQDALLKTGRFPASTPASQPAAQASQPTTSAPASRPAASRIQTVRLENAAKRLQLIERQYDAGISSTLEYQQAKNELKVLETEQTGDPVQIAQVRLEAAKAILKQVEAMNRNGLLTNAELQGAQADVKLRQAELKAIRAASQPAAVAGDAILYVTRAYDIQDLLVHIPDAQAQPIWRVKDAKEESNKERDKAADEKHRADLMAAEIIRLIQETNASNSWQSGGASIRESNGTLIVTQTQTVQDEIAGLINQLRKSRSLQIHVEGHFINPGVDGDRSLQELLAQTGSTILTDDAVRKLLARLVNDRANALIAFPRMTLLNGQPFYVECGSEQPVRLNQIAGGVPGGALAAWFFDGVDLSAQGTISYDHRSVTFNLQPRFTKMLTPGAPRPRYLEGAVSKTVTFADGHWILLPIRVEERQADGVKEVVPGTNPSGQDVVTSPTDAKYFKPSVIYLLLRATAIGVEPPPGSLPAPATRPAIPAAADLHAWVNDFFRDNCPDSKAPRTLEWGEPQRTPQGNYSIRCKYDTNSGGKDQVIYEQVFTFTADGKFLSVEKVNGFPPSSAPASRPATQPAAYKSWGDAVQGLQVAVQVDGVLFNADQPIPVRWAIRNNGDTDRAILWHELQYSPVFFDITDASGTVYRNRSDFARNLIDGIPMPPQRLILRPGEILERTFDLARFGFLDTLTGELKIVGVYAPKAARLISAEYLADPKFANAMMERIASAPVGLTIYRPKASSRAELNKDLAAPAELWHEPLPPVDTEPWRVAAARTLRLEVRQGQLVARLDLNYASWPKAAYLARLEVGDKDGKVLASSRVSFESDGESIERPVWIQKTVEFDLGPLVKLPDGAFFRLLLTCQSSDKSTSQPAPAPQPAPRFQIRLVLPESDTTTPPDEFPDPFHLRQKIRVARHVLLDESALASVTLRPADPDSFPSGPEIELKLNPAGRKLFGRITTKHVNQKLAMIFDGQVLFTPVITTQITSGMICLPPRTRRSEAQTLTNKLSALVVKPLPASQPAPASAPASQPAASAPATQPADVAGDATPYVVRVYDIEDLLAAFPALQAKPTWRVKDTKEEHNKERNQAADEKHADLIRAQLIRFIKEMIAPDSWQSGRASIRKLGSHLVVTQTQTNHILIADFLNLLRNHRSLQVIVEGRFISPGLDGDRSLQELLAQTGGTILTDEAALKLLAGLEKDRANAVIAVPRMWVYNGQLVYIEVGIEQPVRLNQIAGGVPGGACAAKFFDGVSLSAEGAISNDRRSVTFNLQPRFTKMLTPGDPRPHYLEGTVSKTMTLPDGQWLLLPIHVEERQADGVKEVVPGTNPDGQEVVTSPTGTKNVTPSVIYLLLKGTAIGVEPPPGSSPAPATQPAPASRPAAARSTAKGAYSWPPMVQEDWLSGLWMYSNKHRPGEVKNYLTLLNSDKTWAKLTVWGDLEKPSLTQVDLHGASWGLRDNGTVRPSLMLTNGVEESVQGGYGSLTHITGSTLTFSLQMSSLVITTEYERCGPAVLDAIGKAIAGSGVTVGKMPTVPSVDWPGRPDTKLMTGAWRSGHHTSDDEYAFLAIKADGGWGLGRLFGWTDNPTRIVIDRQGPTWRLSGGGSGGGTYGALFEQAPLPGKEAAIWWLVEIQGLTPDEMDLRPRGIFHRASPQLTARLTAAITTQPATQTAPASAPASQAAAAEWGAATQGVQIRLASARRMWNKDETPSFTASVRNNGEKEWNIYQSQAIWTIELDGVRHHWNGEVDAPGSWLPAGRKYDGIPITLIKNWRRIHDVPLELASGKHALRVICPVFPAIGQEKAWSPSFEAVSNIVEFEVAPAR